MDDTYAQMDIYDFIGKSSGMGDIHRDSQPIDTMFEHIFDIVQDPVLQCVNCLCQYCANNAEELYRKVKPEEMQRPCFNCDGCWTFTHKQGHINRVRQQCSGFEISDYGAERSRNRFQAVKGGKKGE